MPEKLLFDPRDLRRLDTPLTILKRTKLNGKTLIKYLHFSNSKIFETYGEELRENTLNKLLLLSEDRIAREQTILKTNHAKLGMHKPVEDYLRKHMGNYFYSAFQKWIPLAKNIPIYHKKRTAKKRYINRPCTFDYHTSPQLTFKLQRHGKTLSLKASFEIEGPDGLLAPAKLKRFGFMIRYEDSFFMLKRMDWQLLEELYLVDRFSEEDFEKKYYKKLKNYPLDTSEAFQEEIREIKPHPLIQVSELGDNLLLFLPRWDYDGTVLDDDKDHFVRYENGHKIIYKRDKKAEQKTLQFLEESHPNFKGQNQFFLKFSEASKNNWFFNFYHNQLKDNFTITGMDMLSYFRYSEEKIQSEFKILKTEKNKVIAHFKTHFGAEKIPTKTLQKILEQEKKFVLLKDHSLGVLSEEWQQEYGRILQNAIVEGDEIRFAKWLLMINQNSTEQKENLNRVLTKEWMEKWKQWNQNETPIYRPPNTVKAQLREYQQKGFEWMTIMAEVDAGTLLADDMGLGKTLQTISCIAYWQALNPKAQFLVVCPASLIYNWKNEFEKFFAALNLFIYHGPHRDFSHFIDQKGGVIITSYALIRNDAEYFTGLTWDGIILDEGHKIKNYQAQQTQAVLALHGKRRIILNGTPIMNNVTDLFPQLKFLLPQLFPSPKGFSNQFEQASKGHDRQQGMKSLKRVTHPFILRRTKESAAPDLPKKTESVLWCEMGKEQRKAYEEIKNQVKENVFVAIKDKGLNKAKLGVLQGITKLRQVCSSPRLLKNEDAFQHTTSVKIETLIDELTSNLSTSKVLIFSQFLGTMDLLKEAFEEKAIRYHSFSGSTPAKKRMEMVDEFQQEDSDIQVFLLSLMAGNSGINLTNANYVFLVEPWWNKAVQQQAIDRTHRIGQKQKVFAYNMVCKDTIEEKIIRLQDEKQQLSDEVIAEDENFVKNLTEEDIAFLFE